MKNLNFHISQTTQRQLTAVGLAVTLSMWSLLSALAYDSLKEDLKDLWRYPIVKQGAVGAAAGGVVGGLSRESSIMRGVGIGALTGVGTGLIDQTGVLYNKPLLRTTAKGAIVGVGASSVMRSSGVKGAVVGAGAGAGYHLLRDYWHD